MHGPSRRLIYGALLLLTIGAAAVYLLHVPEHPPGFYLDESSIVYNAHAIAQSGTDEYGARWPLFFRAFGEYKNPTLVYLLAAVYRLTGPSIATARVATSLLGWSTGLFMGFLAWRISKRPMVGASIAISAWLTPWLFENSRLVLEVAIYPAILVLFLIAVRFAAERQDWSWRNVSSVAVTLALVTYSYSIGRLLGPLLALGLVLFVRKGRWPRLVQTWLLYVLLLVPLALFHFQHPGALTNRFTDLTYLRQGASPWTGAIEFLRHYLANLNPSRWLFTGEHNVRDHLAGTGALLAVTVLLGLAGLVLICRTYRRDPWWRFIVYGLFVSVVPASLTRNEFPQLRLIAFPIFFLILTVPATIWLLELPRNADGRRLIRYLGYAVLIGLTLLQGLVFQYLYHRNAPSLWYVFDARFARKVLAPALTAGSRPIYLVDAPGKSGYIQALWHGLLAGLPQEQFHRTSLNELPPPGSIVISTEEECSQCTLIARSLNYIVYAVPPHPVLKTENRVPLADYHASIIAEDQLSTIRSGERATIRLLIRNTSRSEWPAIGDGTGNHAVELRARWRDSSGKIVTVDELRKRLPYDIEPGDTVGLTCEVTAPDETGEYVLEFDLVEEPDGWFAEHGSKSLRLKMQVVK